MNCGIMRSEQGPHTLGGRHRDGNQPLATQRASSLDDGLIIEQNRTAEAIVEVFQGISGAQDFYTPRNAGAQYFNLLVDRLEAGRLEIDGDAMPQASLLRAQIG
jgi:hypothetical protein